MKDIVLVIGNYQNGGVARRATNLANEFAKKGYNATILATRDLSDESFFLPDEEIKLIHLHSFCEANKNNPLIVKDRESCDREISRIKKLRYVTRFVKSTDKELEYKVRHLRKSRELRDFFLLHGSCTVIAFGIAYYENVYYAVQGLNCRLIYAERNAPELEYPEDEAEIIALFRILSKADGAVLQTQAEKDYYSTYLPSNNAVIHNPIKNNLPAPFTGERNHKIVNFCRLSPQKDLELLIDAFCEISPIHPDYLLEIYGNTVEQSEIEYKQKLLDYISTKPCRDNIRLLPPSADIHNLCNPCAMFVSSSYFEGLSNSMIEAMAIGLPCICTDCLGGGAREIITDGVNGLLTPIKDKTALANAILRFIKDPVFAQSCGQNAAKLREELTAEKIAEKWIKIIDCK